MSKTRKEGSSNELLIDVEIEQEFNASTATDISNKAALEAKFIFNIPIKSWKLESSFIIPNSSQRGNIYSLPSTVNGIITTPSLMMTAIRIGKNKDDFFQYLTSLEGYIFLDPDSDSNDFNKPLLGPFPLPNNNHPSSKVQAEFASLPLSGCLCSCASTREFIVMNSFDFENKAWYSKSVLTSIIYPGHSNYTTDTQQNSNTAIITGNKINKSSCIRIALNTCYTVSDDDIDDDSNNNINNSNSNIQDNSTINNNNNNDNKISPLSSKESNMGSSSNNNSKSNCILKIYIWCDMGGWLRPMNNSFNKKYLVNLTERANKLFPVVVEARNPII